MSSRIYFTAWGRGNWSEPAYAMAQDCEYRPDSVANSIARKSGLEVVSLRADGSDADGRTIHQATLGSPCRGGGWSPEAEVWFSVENQAIK